MSISIRILFFIVIVLLHIFIYFTLFKNVSANPVIKHLGKFIVIANLLCIVFFLRFYHGHINPIIYTLMSSSVGIFWISFNIALIVFVLSWGISLSFGYLTLQQWQGKILMLAWISIFVLIALSFHINAKQPSIIEQTIQIQNLKQPINIAHLSDIHIGVLMDEHKVADIVRKTNELSPDIIVLTGDIVDSYSSLSFRAIEQLGKLKSKYGIYYVLGNHEYYYDTYNILRYIQKLGITTLVNQSMILRNLGINISGVADLVGEKIIQDTFLRPNLSQATKYNIAYFPTILLSHQPKTIKFLNNEKIDLVLSGHTHGGQIFPFNFFVLIDQPFLSGLHEFSYNDNKSQIYISEGVGWWGMPMRLFSRRQINFLHLVPA
ncbi:metallophosphoesterase [Helicobacter muridarum]|uniref:Metallophosphoesterase n=1 Tax=Helicobacter muridarum TaxID=216 RepID=A0A099U0X1_9HELI|nr:metallophosphoesterase [Helicobacter muridarum]TLD98335.1 metallophosphoesterase [Helicobacter muridarum]STQ86499.1 metallophosphoesterase [Helicobacter muridarum]